MENQYNQIFVQMFKLFLQLLIKFDTTYFWQDIDLEKNNLIDLNDQENEKYENSVQPKMYWDNDVWTDDSSFDPNYESNSESELNWKTTPDEEFTDIDEYLENNPDINKQEFFQRSNAISHIDMKHHFERGLNGGTCWNCYNIYSHTCYTACKLVSS